MIKIDLNIPLENLDGTLLTTQGGSVNKANLKLSQSVIQTAGMSLASVLFTTPAKEKASKYEGWARKLYANQPVELDQTDFNDLRSFAEKSEIFTVALAPILNAMDEAFLKSKHPDKVKK